ncbi:MAG: hypothetical protein LBF94_02410, partial [Puniceicoccales bacterium]|nr:hypothetical protein [Puniceicoccales bacterium]
SISKGNAENLKNALLSIKYTYSYRPEPWKGSVNVSVNSQESFANSLHRMQENNIGTALKGAIDDETGGDWNMLYDPLEALEAQLNLIIDYYSKEDAVKALEKKYGANNVEGLKNSIEFSLDNAQKNYDEALGYYERLTAPVEYDRLLSLVLMYNPLDGTGQRVTALTKNTDGTYTATLSQGESTSEFSLRDCEERMSLPYFALAMCYEKMVVVETVIRAHAEEIKDLNAEIIENNNWLKYANGAYQNYYSWAIYSKNGVYADNSSRLWKVISIKAGTTISDENVAMESAKAFLGYLKEECGIKGIDAEKIVHWGDYNTKGEFQKGGDTFNIDVEEQGFLTLISNWQEALRQRGDWLSTESQKKTLELTQDFQIYNSACSITSQVCKMVGGPNDAIASNIR